MKRRFELTLSQVIEDDDEMYYIGGAMGMGWA